MKKYFITTFGCQMNVHESEKLAGILEEMEYSPAEKLSDASVIIFNTCAIREGAVERAFGNIGALKKLKKAHPEVIIIVVGCATQKREIADNLFKTFPFIDVILGTFNIHEIKKYIESHERRMELLEEGAIVEGVPYKRTSGDNAWVNIMYGCNNFCSYCIVPYVRGREMSRNKQDIINEIKGIISEGKYKKITLLGQNVNSYGNDKKGNGTFPELLKDICRLEGDFKLTFMTSHPKDLTDELIDTVANEDKMLKEIHLPMQSGNNRILKLMNRKYTKEKYFEIVDKIRLKIPDVKLTSDFIVGFPTETEEEFNETMEAVKKVGFDGIFAFMYSPRIGTVAAGMEDQISTVVKNRRVNALLKLEKEIQREKRIGRR